MPNCCEMKKGQVYICECCGMELEVIKECKDVETPAGQSVCEVCKLVCCDEELKLKA